MTEEQQEYQQEVEKRHNKTAEQLKQQYCNLYGYREALHTAFIFGENVDTYLVKHPAVLYDDEAFSLAYQASSLLFDLYQRLGALEEDVRIQNEAV